MNWPKGSRLIMLFVAVAWLAGCQRDPTLEKQKYLESGRRYSADGKYREAAIQFANALKIDKNYADAHYELGQAYVRLERFNEAYGEFERTVELAPANYKARIDLGNLSLAGGRTEPAKLQADAVLAAEPDNPDVHAMLSAIAIRQGQTDKALTEIRRALQLEPNRAEFHENLALLLGSDPTAVSLAEEELKKAIALDSKALSSRLLLAAFYSRYSRWQEAERTSWEAVGADPRSLAARAGLAQVFLKQGNQARAEDVFRKASQDLADDPQGMRMLADYYVSSRQLENAKREFSALAARHPKDLSLREGYIRVLLAAKDYATAESAIAELTKKNPKDPEVAGLNGVVLLNEGNPRDAVLVLQGAVQNVPNDDFLKYWLGRAALAKGEIDLAEKSFQSAVNLNPSNLQAEEELAQIARQRGDMNLLSEVAEKTVDAVPQFPGGYLWRALVEARHKAVDKAEADLKIAMTIAPQDPQAYLQLGRLRFEQQRYPEGTSLLERALQYDPNSYEALRLLVSYDLDQKQPDKALTRLRAQITKCPNNSSFYDLLAELQIQNKNLDGAAAAAKQAIQLDSGNAEAVMIYAQIEVQRGRTADALSVWEDWSKSHPDDAGATAVLGTIEEANGDQGKAEVYYKKSLQVQPQQPLASNNLAYLMLEKGENVDVALTLAQTAHRALPNSASTADTLAWAYYHKNVYVFARELLEDAVKTDPDNASMQYHLGMVYTKLRDRNNATIHLRKAMSLAPDSPTAKNAQAALQGFS